MTMPSNIPPASADLLPRLIFWETTRGCNLRCVHCRATATELSSPDDLSTETCLGLIDQIASFSRPILILTGGEPLFRKDIFEIASYGTKKGLRMALATNGTLVDDAVADKISAAGFQRVSISLDGADAATHDAFRMIPGSFEAAVAGLKRLRARGMSVQINTTVAKHNADQLPQVLKLTQDLGADAFHIFLLVPVGCGVEIGQEQMISARQYEEILNWWYDQSKTVMMDLKATCAPHYFRIRVQRIMEEKMRGETPQPFVAPGTQAKAGHVDVVTTPDGQGLPTPALSAMTRGCLAGTGVCFISHKGEVYPCGYLPVSAGDVKKQPFEEIWRDSPVFGNLRNPHMLGGKCGQCEYKFICEGCRARAYAQTGDYMAEEPFCAYEPGERRVGEIHDLHMTSDSPMPETTLPWSEDARAAVARSPFFIRAKIVSFVEEYARKQGLAGVDAGTVVAARSKGESLVR